MSKNGNGFSRRSFLKWSAVAAGLTGGLTACGGDSSDDTIVTGGGGGSVDAPDPILQGGKWVTVPCTSCSQFRCVNRAYMVDGIAVRQKTQDDHEHTKDYPTFRACLRGRAARWSVLSPSRLKYPMKRKNWTPGDPGTDPASISAMKTPHLRGKDEWERISWDDAIRYVYEESRRICQRYGEPHNPTDLNLTTNPNGTYGKKLPILNLCYSVDCEPRFLNWLDYGTMPTYGQNSTGGWPVVRAKIEANQSGVSTNGLAGVNGGLNADRYEIMEKAKLIVQWGQNHSWSKYGPTQLTWRAAKENGAKVFCVDPWFPPGNTAWVDEWIPCRPGTDGALLLAIAYVLETENLCDRTFLKNCCVGYDAESMPLYDQNGNELSEKIRTVDPVDGHMTFTPQSVIINAASDPDWAASGHTAPGGAGKINKYWKLNFKDYILGTYDNVPKTPAWASAICGTPADKIERLARAMGEVVKNGNPQEELVFTPNQSFGRHANGASTAQIFLAVSWMLGGAIGSSFSGGTSSGYVHGYYGGGAPYFTVGSIYGGGRTPYPQNLSLNVKNPKSAGAYGAIGVPADTIECNYKDHLCYGIAFAEVPDAVETGKYHHFVQGLQDCDIRGMLKLFNGNMSNQNVNAKGYIKAHRNPKVEFVAAADFFMSTEARYADIILPATSLWEEEHYSLINPEIFIGNPHKIVEPLFEAKNDFEMEELLMRAAGADRGTAKSWSYPGNRNIREHVVNGFLEMRVTLGGVSQYLLSFDNDDLNELGVNAVVTAGGTLTQGVIPYKQFKEKGFYQARVTEYNRQTRIPGLVSFLSEIPAFADNSASLGENNHWKRTSTIATETGFYEIFSMNLYNYYMNFWYDAPALSLSDAANVGKLPTDLTIPSQLLYPIPVYRKQPDGYEASREGATYYNGTAVSANEFPFQYISLHPHNRSHSTRNDNKNILEIFDDLLFIHPETAAAAGGLAHGDTVILTSSTGGKIMRRVSLSNTVIPGVVIGTEGCTVRNLDDEATAAEVDFDNVIDYGGAANSLTASFRVGQAHQAYNTVIVKMERAPGKLVPQYKWEPDLPESARVVVSEYYKTN